MEVQQYGIWCPMSWGDAQKIMNLRQQSGSPFAHLFSQQIILMSLDVCTTIYQLYMYIYETDMVAILMDLSNGGYR